MNRQQLVTLRKQVIEYHDKIASKWKFSLWGCTVCGKNNVHNVPTYESVGRKGYWDSTTICTHCGGVSFVLYSPKGHTESRSFDDPDKIIFRRFGPMSLAQARKRAALV